MTKLIVIGDLHLDAQISGRDYHDDIRDKLHDIAIQCGDVVVQLGDVCDPDNGPRTWRALDTAREWIVDVTSMADNVEVFLLVGNHDRIDDVRAQSSIACLTSPAESVRVVDSIARHRLAEGIWGLFVPWQSRAHGEFDVLAECLGCLDWMGDDKAIVFCHQDIPGALPGGETDLPRLGQQVLPQEIIDDPRVLNVFAGHLHTPGQIGAKVEIVGSLECLGMGERDVTDRGYLEVEL